MAGRVYDKRAWKRIRAQQLRREPLCAMCMERGVAKPAVDVDHVVPLADGGEPFAFENMRSLCHEDHARVTAAARLGRDVVMRGCDAAGHPLDAAHWWNAK